MPTVSSCVAFLLCQAAGDNSNRHMSTGSMNCTSYVRFFSPLHYHYVQVIKKRIIPLSPVASIQVAGKAAVAPSPQGAAHPAPLLPTAMRIDVKSGSNVYEESAMRRGKRYVRKVITVLMSLMNFNLAECDITRELCKNCIWSSKYASHLQCISDS